MCSNTHIAEGSTEGSACITFNALFESDTTSPGFTSRMASQPSVCNAPVSEATACPPLGSNPTHSGRNPQGSRTAYTQSRVRITSEYAPTHFFIAVLIRSSHVAPPLRASIIVITSVSDDDESPTPCCINSFRNSVELTKLPLWANANGP